MPRARASAWDGRTAGCPAHAKSSFHFRGARRSPACPTAGTSRGTRGSSASHRAGVAGASSSSSAPVTGVRAPCSPGPWIAGATLGEQGARHPPFAFDLPTTRSAGPHRLVLRVDDTPHPFKLEGKQGYGPAHGIWQTIYLEARGSAAAPAVPFPHPRG